MVRVPLGNSDIFLSKYIARRTLFSSLAKHWPSSNVELSLCHVPSLNLMQTRRLPRSLHGLLISQAMEAKSMSVVRTFYCLFKTSVNGLFRQFNIFHNRSYEYAFPYSTRLDGWVAGVSISQTCI